MAGGVVGGWSRLDGGAHVAMISIPMLLTRRGWLGWATPYFLSLFLRLTSLHAPRPQFSSSFPRLLQPSSDPLAIFYSVIFASLPFTPPPHPHSQSVPLSYSITPPFFLRVAFLLLLSSSSRSHQFRPLSLREDHSDQRGQSCISGREGRRELKELEDEVKRSVAACFDAARLRSIARHKILISREISGEVSHSASS